MLVKTNAVCPLIYLYIHAYVQDEADSALCPHDALSTYSILKYFVNKMGLVYSSFYVHHRVNCGSIVPGMQKGRENISYGLSIFYCIAQVSFLCL